MEYLVISDTHGHCSEVEKAIEEKGGLENKKLILVGDILDRGDEAVRLTDYLIKLLKEDKLILIRGNHEDLLEDAIRDIENGKIWWVATASHHTVNGTFDTLLQLSGMTGDEAVAHPKELIARVRESAFYKTIMPACVDFYETDNYVFTHGWIPCITEGYGAEKRYYYNADWRNATPEQWRAARWFNGMNIAFVHRVVEPDKTVVCGHIHASYGHACIDMICTEYGPDVILSPYYGDGVIGIDGCVARSGKINCIEIDD